VFVLSIDKKHLSGAVKGFYGSEQIDTNEYLRRFIDLEYSIPKPSTENYTNYLFEYYAFKDFFSSIERLNYNELRNDAEYFLSMAEFILTKSNATLRQQERIFAHTRLVLCSFEIYENTFSHLLFLLVYIKIMRDDVFQKIENNEFSIQELSACVNDLLYGEIKDYSRINLGYVEALLFWFYNNNREYPKKINLLEKNEEGKSTTSIKSKLIMANYNLADYFQDIERLQVGHLKLDFLLKKINLTEPITVQ
jgi:hypothetical protein